MAMSNKSNILIVEDDREIAEKFRRGLEQSYNGSIVGSVDQVFQSLLEVIDIILLDIILVGEKMPRDAGIHILERLKKERSFCHIPIIVITGRDDPEVKERCQGLGAEAFLRKPVSITTLRRTVEEALTSRKQGNPIWLLHLSDLHFTPTTSPESKLQLLLQDLHKDECLGSSEVEYLIISGDMTDKGSKEGLEKAREFVLLLIDELGVSAKQCIFVPGNHDLQYMEEAYYCCYLSETKARMVEPDEDQWHREGNVILVPSKDRYPERLKMYSEEFFGKIIGEPYPLDYAQQGFAYLFPKKRVLFLTLNSCWQIDRFHPKRSGLHRDAVAHVIAEANHRIKEAKMKKSQKLLQFCVWHHSIKHRETMQNTDSIEVLQDANIQICLHGDVHEINRDLFKYWHKNKIHVIGAGSFGSPVQGRPESIPRLYNLLKISPDLSSVRVHTRRQMRPDGRFDGFYEWDDPDGGQGRVPFYDIELS